MPMLQHFQDQTGHAIDAGITTGNDAHRLTCQGTLDGEPGSGHFLGQRHGNTLLVVHQVRYPLEITIVPNNHIGTLQGRLSLSCEQR
jgi:hypothetical protein